MDQYLESQILLEINKENKKNNVNKFEPSCMLYSSASLTRLLNAK